MTPLSAFQTVGPYFALLVNNRKAPRLVAPDTPGQITIEGCLYDGASASIPDGLVEIWHADREGRYRHPEDPRASAMAASFSGHGWFHTRADGGFSFTTIKPGAVPGPDGRPQAPHILVSILGRGILSRYVTRLYFEDEPANAQDPILALVPEARRQTLIARATGSGRYRFDVVLQGPAETVFFDV